MCPFIIKDQTDTHRQIPARDADACTHSLEPKWHGVILYQMNHANAVEIVFFERYICLGILWIKPDRIFYLGPVAVLELLLPETAEVFLLANLVNLLNLLRCKLEGCDAQVVTEALLLR